MKMSGRLALFMLLAVQASSYLHATSFLPLGVGIGGSGISSAGGVSDDGAFVAVNTSDAEGPGLFGWTAAGGLQLIARDTSAFGVSADGSTLVGATTDPSSGVSVPSMWTTASGLNVLGLPPGEVATIATASVDVSHDGSIVVGNTSVAGQQTAFLWTESAGFTFFLNGLSDASEGSVATKASADGSVIVGFSVGENGAGGPYRWTAAGGAINLGTLNHPSDIIVPTAVSGDGETVYGTVDSLNSKQAFRWTAEGGMVGLGQSFDIPSSELPIAATELGEAVVGQSTQIAGGDVDTEAFLWTHAYGGESLQGALSDRFGLADELQGWVLIRATDISLDGTVIVGDGINPSGVKEAWLVRLDQAIFVPEPSAFYILASLGMWRHRTRRRN
jgi:hypothetical protein